MSEPLTPEERIERAVQEVYALAKSGYPGGHTFRMTVPPDASRDSDLILLAGLDAARSADSGLDAALQIVRSHVSPISDNVDYSRGWEAVRASIERELRAALSPSTPKKTL